MRASCENCGKLGDMTPGKPFVCGVCGHFHDLPVVDSRIAAAERALREKVDEERKAAAERKAARERLIGTLRPRADAPATLSPDTSRRRPEAYREPLRYPSSESARVPFLKSASGCGSCLWKLIKIVIAVVIFICFVKSCVFDAPQPSRTQPIEQQHKYKRPIGQDAESTRSPTRNSADNCTKAVPEADHVNAPRAAPGVPRRQQVNQTWRPGVKHPKWPHIYASETPGTWVLEKGYEFIYPGTDNWSVRKIVEYVRCAKCSGTGTVKTFYKCSLCNGRRTMLVPVSEINRRTGLPQVVNRRRPCSACQGRGGANINGQCPKCNGARVVPKGAR